MHPSIRFLEVDVSDLSPSSASGQARPEWSAKDGYLLEIVYACASSDRDLRRGIGIISRV